MNLETDIVCQEFFIGYKNWNSGLLYIPHALFS